MGGTACAAALLLAAPVYAGPVTFITRAPADPARLTVEADQSQLQGALDKRDLTDLIEARRQADGTFVESGDVTGIVLNRPGRGAVIDDFNRDGMLDLLVVNRKQNVSLVRNPGRKTEWGHTPLGNWVEITLEDTNGNTHAVGARLLVAYLRLAD